jgi:hypothetical protein
MTEQEQIEEMAKDMCGNGMKNGCCAMDDDPCTLECVYGRCAEKLFAKSYRKQSEGEWLTDKYGMDRSVCSLCNACYEGDVGRYCPNCGAKMRGPKP